jgi:HD-like signal output (HDOD) protein/HPt (histidine-containing phosphotransfer) domain-containing protein
MGQNYDWDTYEFFRDQLVEQLPKIEANILKLDKPNYASDSIDELFRSIHSYKPIAEYLGLKPFYILLKKAETVLSSLRKDSKKVVQESIVEWLLDVKDQFNIWIEEMENNETDLTSSLNNLENKIEISKSYIPLKEILKNLTILYIDKDPKRIKKISPFLSKLVNEVISASDEEKCNSLIEQSSYDILILNANAENYLYAELARQRNINIPILAIFDSIDSKEQLKLIKHSISSSAINPLNSTTLKEALVFLTKNYFVSKNIKIDNKKISEYILTLDPLPHTIMQIMQICDDEEIPLKDLIKTVKGDPIIAAKILHSANSPLYGSVELTTIDQAVSRLGKSGIKAFVSSDMYKNLNTIDLTPYNMDEEKFSQVSMNRLNLAVKWYSKVSISDLSILSSTAVLGNIGQLLLAKEIISIGETELFRKLCSSHDIKYAEGNVLHTSTTSVSAQILNYWQLSSEIVNIIAFSQNPHEASDDVKKLVIANNIIYDLVKLDGTIEKEIPNEIMPLLAEYNFDATLLSNALEYLNQNQK